MRFDTAVIDTESATLPPERCVSTCEMLPGGQHATRIIPSAIDGVTGRISVSANVTAGSTISCARIAITKGLGLRATTLKSSGEVSRAMPNMISPSTTFRMMSVPGAKFRTTSSMFMRGSSSSRSAAGCCAAVPEPVEGGRAAGCAAPPAAKSRAARTARR